MQHLRPKCSHFIYWEVDGTANPPTAGHCHRYPPGVSINPKTGTVVQKFPTTDQHQWCGEWNGDETLFVEAIRQIAMESAQ